MELKDKLKKLRLDLGLTQSQLAEKLFVSRSTVAKWENGLGLPNEESMKLLEEHFGITQRDIATTQPEEVIVQKNRKLRLFLQIVGWAAVLALLVVMYILPFAIHRGDYGFTWDMAAGVYADNAYIDTGDYRIYYFQFAGETEDDIQWSTLQGWRPALLQCRINIQRDCCKICVCGSPFVFPPPGIPARQRTSKIDWSHKSIQIS